MTEIPDHLLRRAQQARERGAAEIPGHLLERAAQRAREKAAEFEPDAFDEHTRMWADEIRSSCDSRQLVGVPVTAFCECGHLVAVHNADRRCELCFLLGRETP